MRSLQRRYLALTGVALVLVGLLLVSGLLVPRLYAEGALPASIVPLFDWISMSGLAALFGVGVHWGDTRAKLRNLSVARNEDRETMKEGFERIDRQIETLFELLGAERRAQRRRDFGLRTEDEPPLA